MIGRLAAMDYVSRALEAVAGWREPAPVASRAAARPRALRGRVGGVHRADGGQLSVPSPALRGADAQAAAPGGDRRLHGGDARQHEQPRARRRAGDERDGGRGDGVAGARCSGFPAESLGHLTSSGTIANLEALWVARELHPGKAVVHGANAHYTHSRMCAVLGHRGVRGAGGRRTAGSTWTWSRSCARPATSGRSSSPRARPAPGPSTTSRARSRCASATACGCTSTPRTAGSSRCWRATPALVPRRRSWPSPAPTASSSTRTSTGCSPTGAARCCSATRASGRLYKHDSPYTYFTSAELHLGEISLECSRAGAAAAALWLTLRALDLAPILAAGVRAARAWAELIADVRRADALHREPGARHPHVLPDAARARRRSTPPASACSTPG